MKPALNPTVIRALVVKDWQLFERQLAGYTAVGLLALALIGHAQAWSFYAGALLLIVVMSALACFAISTSTLSERKAKTLAFVMSLPVSPLDFYVAKLLANMVTFGVPYLLLGGGAVAVTLWTPIPDGLLTLVLMVLGHLLLAHAVSLCVAMRVESEGWSTFVMVGGSVLVNPFMAAVSQVPEIATPWQGEVVTWSWQVLTILALQVGLSLALLASLGWHYLRKQAFY